MTDTETNTPGDSPMTPDEMIAAWRQLLADGHGVTLEPSCSMSLGVYCSIEEFNGDGSSGQLFEVHDADPLRAFEKAYRKWQEGTGR